MTLLGRKLERQYGMVLITETTTEEGYTSSENENCDNEIEKSEASFKVENQKSENTQPLNKISPNQPIQFKEGNTEVDNFTQFLGKVLHFYATCALKNNKLAAKFSPSGMIKQHR